MVGSVDELFGDFTRSDASVTAKADPCLLENSVRIVGMGIAGECTP